MHMYIRMLDRILSRSGPSRSLSFGRAHVLKYLQLMQRNQYVGRATAAKELGLGEGSVKTLIKHLKNNGIVQTQRAGCSLTPKGRKLVSNLMVALPAEVQVPTNSITVGKYNYAILLRDYAFAVGSGVEQRDEVIRFGGDGATTLLLRDNRFVMPNTNHECLSREPRIRELLLRLEPKDSDVIIIGSGSTKLLAELGSKAAALFTIAGHEKHNL